MKRRVAVALAAVVLAVAAPAANAAAQSRMVGARVDHLALQVADMDAGAAFYQDVFGFQPTPGLPPGARARWLDLGEFQLHLISGRDAAVQTPKAVHFAIAVEDLDAVAARLSARGHVWGDFAGQAGVVSTGRSDGVRQIFVQDPDGYWIEVNDRQVGASD